MLGRPNAFERSNGETGSVAIPAHDEFQRPLLVPRMPGQAACSCKLGRNRLYFILCHVPPAYRTTAVKR
ncbi:hypothetical protein MicloDRAFT_00069180 [Microvirga lotononidis]|uniref:Uncharacterized protein n=1 Tax=Microvirga lotononidis TaxID=864069 RepID=I4YKA7_9HYPH|nr:hypothetical protein MicloDRAFT_00069180 [Microvirga lotononidis]